MTKEKFRLLALEVVGATEGSHQGHVDFRLDNKVFASLGYPSANFGMIIIPPALQRDWMKTSPEVFSAASGAWGKRGSTLVRLATARVDLVRQAFLAAVEFRATKK